MRRFVFAVLMLAVSACSGIAGLPEEGLGDNWITEDRIAPGLTDRDRVLHSFPIENADGWTVEKGEVRVEKGVAVPIANPIEIPDFKVQHPILKYTPERVAQLRASYEKDPGVAAKSIEMAEAAIAEWQGKPYHRPAGAMT